MRVGTLGASCGVLVLLALPPGCGDPATPRVTSQIAVSNQTSGDPVAADGYTVRLDGDAGHPLAVGGSILLTDLDPGDHTLELTGLAAECAVNGVNPRTVHADPGGTARSLFLVACNVPGTGRLIVQTFTYGSGDGNYLLELDRGLSRGIGPNDEVTFFALPEGPVTITLSDTGRCVVADPNPRTVRVRAGQELASLFKVRCDQ